MAFSCRYAHHSHENKNTIPQVIPSCLEGVTSNIIGWKTLSQPNKSMAYTNPSNSSAHEPHKTIIHMFSNDDKDGKGKDSVNEQHWS